MPIGERDWETEFFVGSAPTRQSIVAGMARIKEDLMLTEVNRSVLLRFNEAILKEIEQTTYDPIGDKPEETPRSFLKKYLGK